MDGRNNFETKDVSEFSGLLAAVRSQKAEFPDTASPMWKNFISTRGVLETRKGRKRLNATAYASTVSFLAAYTNRNADNFLVFGIRATNDSAASLSGTLESVDLDTLLA